MNDWKVDHDWGLTYLPQVKAIVGPHLLVPAPLHEDCVEATDMLVLKARDMRIACRIRRPDCRCADWLRQFTIRSHRSNGMPTELRKIMAGWGDWMFYAFATDDDANVGRLNPWFLIDLSAFRAQIARDGYRLPEHRRLRFGEKTNRDGKTKFYYYEVDSFDEDPPLLVASEEAT